MKLHYYLFLAFIIIASGCSKTSNPVTTTVTTTTAPGAADFGFTTNGSVVARKNDANSPIAYGELSENTLPPMYKILDFLFGTSQTFGGSKHNIEFHITINGVLPFPAQYPVSATAGIPFGSIVLHIDSLTYDITNAASDIGMVEITKYDTVANLVSGKFSFISTLTWPVTGNFPKRDTVNSGFFTDVPIAIGSYGQGSVTANIDGFAYDTKSSSQYILSAYVIGGNTELQISVFSPRNPDQRDLSIHIGYPPKVGVYSFSQFANDTSARFYYTSTIGGKYAFISADSKTHTGQISITKSDTAQHRIWGIFNFSGTENGNSTVITNGVIDSLQWYKE